MHDATDFPRAPGFDLTGKHALVVGASSGIGLAAAVALAENGARVTLAARRADRLRDIASRMQARGWHAGVLGLDISDVEATQRAIGASGPFDILVNSAGTALHSDATETRIADFDDVMTVNLRGAFFLTRAVAQGLIAAGQPGSLINISSQMGLVGGPERAVYCASKHAVEGFTKAMAIDWGGRGIRVNTICPTFILTDLTRPSFDDPKTRAWIMDQITLGRAGTPGDVVGAVLYLASDASGLVTGSALRVDGGWTAA
ncbi:MAG: SDR family NAD(P)-dependent oxidoreductase [Paracoccaceae bacterium]